MRLVCTCGSKLLVLFCFVSILLRLVVSPVVVGLCFLSAVFVHTLLVFYIDISIGVYFFIQFVLFNDVIGHVRDFESHVLGSFHWSVQIEVADVNGHEF